jgi:hypothetical protein
VKSNFLPLRKSNPREDTNGKAFGRRHGVGVIIVDRLGRSRRGVGPRPFFYEKGVMIKKIRDKNVSFVDEERNN